MQLVESKNLFLFMKTYNLYYKNKLINRTPINSESLDRVLSQKYITKIFNKTAQKILVSDIRVSECYIV